jgi:hypothetical protein
MPTPPGVHGARHRDRVAAYREAYRVWRDDREYVEQAQQSRISGSGGCRCTVSSLRADQSADLLPELGEDRRAQFELCARHGHALDHADHTAGTVRDREVQARRRPRRVEFADSDKERSGQIWIGEATGEREREVQRFDRSSRQDEGGAAVALARGRLRADAPDQPACNIQRSAERASNSAYVRRRAGRSHVVRVAPQSPRPGRTPISITLSSHA